MIGDYSKMKYHQVIHELFLKCKYLFSCQLLHVILPCFSPLITGQVSDLKGHFVTQVAMGKAHTCVLIKSGEVWTFGVNNKGQCGRDTGAMSQAGKGEGFSHFS